VAARVGIELSPWACRIIEIESGLPWVRRAPDTRATPRAANTGARGRDEPAPPAPSPALTPPATSSARVGREPERVQPPAPRPDARPSTPASTTRSDIASETTAVEPPPRRQTPPRTLPAESPLAFDASMETILYSPERKLAIVDGRIVGVGDEVRGARVTEITPNAVLLRDAQGRCAASGTCWQPLIRLGDVKFLMAPNR
jgi:hypothetical protein